MLCFYAYLLIYGPCLYLLQVWLLQLPIHSLPKSCMAPFQSVVNMAACLIGRIPRFSHISTFVTGRLLSLLYGFCLRLKSLLGLGSSLSLQTHAHTHLPKHTRTHSSACFASVSDHTFLTIVTIVCSLRYARFRKSMRFPLFRQHRINIHWSTLKQIILLCRGPTAKRPGWSPAIKVEINCVPQASVGRLNNNYPKTSTKNKGNEQNKHSPNVTCCNREFVGSNRYFRFWQNKTTFESVLYCIVFKYLYSAPQQP